MPKRSDGKVSAPKLVNRGGAGILTKPVEDPAKERPPDPTRAVLEGPNGKVNRISPGLKSMIVDVESLTPDPNNARVHGDRNMEAIMASLKLYGQMKPIVVRKQDMVVAAGNGTLEAIKRLGWTKVAANVVPMTEEEFAGYGLADNRSAELAAWDFEVVDRLDRFLVERGQANVGWTGEELAVLRREIGDVAPPDQFPEVDEGIETEHECPRCGYRFSGGSVVPTGGS